MSLGTLDNGLTVLDCIPANEIILSTQDFLLGRGKRFRNSYAPLGDRYTITFEDGYFPDDEESNSMRLQGWVGFGKVWNFNQVLKRRGPGKKALTAVTSPLIDPTVMA